ncbi:Uncharacterised protein [Yersinia enterocolitica]|nr:Uncharacterised protein [Yersinia enterocolitica]
MAELALYSWFFKSASSNESLEAFSVWAVNDWLVSAIVARNCTALISFILPITPSRESANLIDSSLA